MYLLPELIVTTVPLVIVTGPTVKLLYPTGIVKLFEIVALLNCRPLLAISWPAVKLPPMFTLPPIPTPPVTINAPVVVFVDCVALVILIALVVNEPLFVILCNVPVLQIVTAPVLVLTAVSVPAITELTPDVTKLLTVALVKICAPPM
jgi:hypothetical protein